MVSDLFSLFDDHYLNEKMFHIYIYIFPTSLFFMVFSSVIWEKLSKADIIYVMILDLSSLLINLWGKKYIVSGFSLWVSSVFMLLTSLDFFSLFSYSYKSSSNIIVSLSLGFTVWLTLGFSSLFWNPVMFIQQFVPQGCTIMVSPIMPLLEAVSAVARLVTISARFSVNMMVGSVLLHMVYKLSWSGACELTLMKVNVMMFFEIFLSVGITYVEVFVSILQQMIFCMICSGIHNDHTMYFDSKLIFCFL